MADDGGYSGFDQDAEDQYYLHMKPWTMSLGEHNRATEDVVSSHQVAPGRFSWPTSKGREICRWRTSRACYGLWNVWRASWSPSSYCGWIRAVMDWKMRVQDYLTKSPQDSWYDHASGWNFAFDDYAKVVTSCSRSCDTLKESSCQHWP